MPYDSYMHKEAVVKAVQTALAKLIECLEEGPIPFSEPKFGDTGYDERIWKPAIRYWLGQAELLIEFLEKEGQPISEEEKKITNNLHKYYGDGYRPCGVCAKWHAPESMFTWNLAGKGECLVCAGCEELASV